MPQEEKMKLADYLIDTSGGFEATRKRTEEVYEALLREASTSVSAIDDGGQPPFLILS